MTRLLLIRHGETAWTRQKRYQGHTDIPLSASGEKQVRHLCKRLSRCKIHIFYASALTRAAQTAAILRGGRNARLLTDDRINEFNFGEWEGKTARELIQAKEPSYRKWRGGDWVTPPGGESLRTFKKRTGDFLAEILKQHRGKTVAIVAHGGPIRMLMIRSLGLAPRFFWTLHIQPASVSVLDFDSGFVRWVAVNDLMRGNPK